MFRSVAQILDLFFLFLLSYCFVKTGLRLFAPILALVILIEIGYQLSGSLGKSIFGLSVTLRNRWQLYFRETVGKFISLATFGIGFLLVLGKDETTFHDLLAKTAVISAPLQSSLQRRIRATVLVTVALIAGFYLAHINISPNVVNETQHIGSDQTLNAVMQQTPAVLTITCYKNEKQPYKLGSGFLISPDGVAITNFHVIQGAYRAEAQLGDGRLYQIVAVRNFDPDLDIAVLQLGRKIGGEATEVKGLPFVQFGDSETVKVGDRVAAIGSPEGLSNTVSDGLLSAKRNIGSRSLFQITAPISPGSSGGPLFTLDGKVVGVSVAQLGEGQNLNFAIPINAVQKIQQQDYHLGFDEVRILSAGSSSHHLREDRSGEPITDNQQPSKQSILSGFYVGTVHNLTADTSSTFGIVSEEHNGTLAGCMMVIAPLFGSGPFDGVQQGSHVQFTVVHSETQLNFDGTIQNHQVVGSYTVSTLGTNPQYGEFSLKRRNRAVPLDFLSSGCPTDENMNKQ